jgi:cytochrome c oxidase subunit III
MSTQSVSLPADRRAQQGGFLFLGALLMFFLSSILLYLLYAFVRRDELETAQSLPSSFLLSTGLLLAVSLFLHFATISVRREQRQSAITLLVLSVIGSLGFMGAQGFSLWEVLSAPQFALTPHKGVVGMVIVLAVLHALHVVGGVIALGIVTSRAALGLYDHERHWAVDFAALYWHFLDIVWICMLVAFWGTSGGFQFG